MNREEKLLLRIADVGFLVRWKNCSMVNENTDYDKFIHYDGINGLKKQLTHLSIIDVRRESQKRLPEIGGVKKLLAIPKFWSLYKNNSRYIMEIFQPARNELLGLSLIDNDFKNIEFFPMEPDKRGKRVADRWILAFLIQPLVKYLLVNILAKQGGCLVHGAGVKINNRGILFTGRSGSGKTTLGKIFRRHNGITVLTDESVAIIKKNDGFYIQGTPWPGGGRIAEPYGAPLKKIFFIRHGKDNLIKPVDSTLAFKKILSQSIVYAWDKNLIASTMSFIKELINKVEYFDLQFVNDAKIVAFIRNTLDK
jgi:hypothetical protein